MQGAVLQLWEAVALLTKLSEAAATWSNEVPTYEKGKAKLPARVVI